MSVLQIFRGDDLMQEVVLSRAVVGLGRHPQNDVVLDDRSLSRFHARVERRGDRFVVVDCGAQNGVHLNGQRVEGEQDLAPGDRITLGRYVAVFDAGAMAQPKSALKAPPPTAKPLEEPPRSSSKNSEPAPRPAEPSSRRLESPPKTGARPEAPARNVEAAPKAKQDAPQRVGARASDVDRGRGRPPPPARDALAELEAELDLGGEPAEELEEPADPTRNARPKDIEPGAARGRGEPTFVLLLNGSEVSRYPAQGTMTIGRSKHADIVISLLGLSRKHAEIVRQGSKVTVRDLESQNGTWVNNERIDGVRQLKHGDLLNFYDYAVLFLEDGNAEISIPAGQAPAPSEELDAAETFPPSTGARAAARAMPEEPDREPARRAEPARSPVPVSDLSKPGRSDVGDLGEGSFLGHEFDDDAEAENGELSPSLQESDPLDDLELERELERELDGDLGNELDDGASAGEPAGGATDIVNELEFDKLKRGLDELDSVLADGPPTSRVPPRKAPLDDDLNERTEGQATPGWPDDTELARALSNSPDHAIVSLEVTLAGKPYTQMALSQPVTRVGADARCELSLPRTSGLQPWHLTLLHLGGAVVLYRAARTARIGLRGQDVDMALLRDKDVLELGKVRITVRMK